MYRKLMMLLAVVSVLGLAIGLVGCPKKAKEPVIEGGRVPMESGPNVRPAPETQPGQ